MRAFLPLLLVAEFAAAPLAAQEQARVVRGLSFEGNRALDDYTLGAAIVTSNSSWFARAFPVRLLGLGSKRTFNELEFRRDVVRLLLLYRQSGYMNAVVDTLVRREGRDVYVTFHVYEGEPVRVSTLDVRGVDSILDLASLRRALPLQVGDPFNRPLFEASGDTVVSWLQNRGYPYANVLRGYDVDVAALKATATLDVEPGRRMRTGEVLISGALPGDTATVRRALSIKTGDWFAKDRLYQTQRDLYGLSMFRAVNVVLADTSAPPPPDSTVGVRVRVSEAPRHRVLAGGGYGSLDCFRVQGGWTAYDFLGDARSLELSAQLSKLGAGFPSDWGLRNNVCGTLHDDPTSDTVNYNAALTVRQPAFLSPRHTASLALFAERRSEFKAYTRQAVGANLAVTLNARRAIPVTLGYSYSVGRTTADPAVECSVFRVCADSDRALLASLRPFAAVSVTGVRNRTNSLLDPTDGSLITASVAHASRLVGSDTLYEFNRGQIEVSRYFPIGRRGAFAWRLLAGTLLPARRITLDGQSVRFIPPDQRFYGGGPNSVRGYARNELGPRVYVTDSQEIHGRDTTYANLRAEPTGGNSIFVLNAELRFGTPVLPDRMRMAVFTDVGQVWERGNPLSNGNGVRITPGVGVRFATPLGPVRLDAAYNGYPPEAGPVYVQNSVTRTLTIIPNLTIHPSLPSTFRQRIVVQLAVGQAF